MYDDAPGAEAPETLRDLLERDLEARGPEDAELEAVIRPEAKPKKT